MTAVPSINATLAPFVEAETTNWADVEAALIAREDQVADFLRAAGANLGGDAALVAKAIIDIGIGTPPTDEVAAHINHVFAERMAYYQQLFEQQRRPEGGEEN